MVFYYLLSQLYYIYFSYILYFYHYYLFTFIYTFIRYLSLHNCVDSKFFLYVLYHIKKIGHCHHVKHSVVCLLMKGVTCT